MKIRIKVTKEVLKASMWCGTPKNTGFITRNCAISVALADVFGDVGVGVDGIVFYSVNEPRFPWVEVPISKETLAFVSKFDSLCSFPKKRLELPEYSFEVDLPESVINSINIDDIHNSKTLEVVS